MNIDILTQPESRRLWPMAAFTQHDPGAGERADTSPRVLVVEDDFLVADEMVYWLRKAGFDVIGPAATADDAVRLARETKPQLVVMDIRLAGPGDGIEAAIQIYRQLGVRSIFATAHSDPRTRERGMAANPLAWMPKPYSPVTLIETIRTLLDDSTD